MNLKEECGSVKILEVVLHILFVMSPYEKLRRNKTKWLYISKVVKEICIIWVCEMGRKEENIEKK